MMAPESGNAIEKAASAWVARMASGNVSIADRGDLQVWLDADPRRRGAYVRAQAMWRMLDVVASNSRLDEDDPQSNITRLAVSRPPADGIAAYVSRRGLIAGGGALAASLALALAIPSMNKPKPQSFVTASGQIKQFSLSDGSHILLDRASRVDVAMLSDERQVNLLHGEGWFEVAKDKARPFIVQSGDMRVRAVGTAFSVSRGDDMQLIVTEGVVELSFTTMPKPLRLHRGESATIDRHGQLRLAVLTEDAIRRRLAWREGSIGLDGETLGEAAARFNRYNHMQVVINDEQLSREQVVGWFSVTDPQGFAEAAGAMLNAHVVRQNGAIHLSR
ncbi:FecR family protein [Sphingobium sp.]|uniref:FecR family protein n=1 Tax=Sphingobium sp. TaxID=1912891 RepID=UPI0028BE9AA9|nr:FecR domain-containing protein [Sphingobium sp.]